MNSRRDISAALPLVCEVSSRITHVQGALARGGVLSALTATDFGLSLTSVLVNKRHTLIILRIGKNQILNRCIAKPGGLIF